MRRLWAGALVVVAVAAAGCGGDDDETTAAPATVPAEVPTALSKEELIAQGDAICAEVNAAVGTLASSETSAGAGQASDLYSGMVERLKELGAPSDDTAGYGEFVAAAEELDQAESNVGLAAERGEEEGLATAEAEASSALASFQSAATSYGFEQCGEGPSAPVSGSAATPSEPESESAEGVEEEVAPEAEEEVAPETGGAGSAEEGGAGGGATAGGGTEGGGSSGGESSGGIGPG